MTRLSDAALADLRARSPVGDVAGRLGVTLRRVGRTLMGPCPICGGGAQATLFEVKTEESWVCAVCADGGDVIRLVERANGLDFRAAVEWLGGAAAIDPAQEARLAAERAAKQARREAEAKAHREAERRRLHRVWSEAAPIGGTLAARYLESRGLNPYGLRLRFLDAMPFFQGEVRDERGRRVPRRIHVGPALLAPIQRPDGLFTGLHLTWLAADGCGKATIADPETGEILPAKKMRGSVKGGRIELISRREPAALVLGEGIETVVTAADALGRPAGTAFWSALDLGNLGGTAATSVAHPSRKHGNGHAVRLPGPDPDLSATAIPLPASLRELVLLGDGDSDRFKTEASLSRATRRYARPGLTIRHAWAPEGQDLNDLVKPEPVP